MKVSIITVVYNGAKTIERTMQSVFSQSYKSIEYIVIDGGSIDGTGDIIKKYKNLISYYVCEKDNGLYHAMNKGIACATGDILGIINSDDWYEKDAVEKIVGFFEKNNVDVVHGHMIKVLADGSKQLVSHDPIDEIYYKMVVMHPTVFIKRNIYEQYGCFDLKYQLAADYELILRLYSSNVKFGYIDDVIAYFSVGGISERKRINTIEEHRDISMKYIEKSGRKDELNEELEKWYKWSVFSAKLQEQKTKLVELLNKYFEVQIHEIFVFGTGIWGNYCFDMLTESDVKIKAFIDNDDKKWNQNIHGIPIIKPKQLKDEKGYILIAVKYGGDKIEEQLKKLNNERIESVTLREVKSIFEENEIYDK